MRRDAAPVADDARADDGAREQSDVVAHVEALGSRGGDARLLPDGAAGADADGPGGGVEDGEGVDRGVGAEGDCVDAEDGGAWGEGGRGVGGEVRGRN